MNRRDILKSIAGLAMIATMPANAGEILSADVAASGATEAQGRGHGHGGGFGGPPGHGGFGGPPGRALGWGGGNSRWAATRGRKRGWYKRHRRW